MTYQILPINEEHIKSYCDALDSVAKEKKYLGFLEGPTFEMSRSFVMKNIEDNWPHFIALSEGKVIGWCDITSLDRPIFHHAGILGMGIIFSHRGKGVGEALLGVALKKAKDIGLTRIELTVRQNNIPAIKLYTKFDFKIEGLHRNAVRIDNIYENHISMALLFEEQEDERGQVPSYAKTIG